MEITGLVAAKLFVSSDTIDADLFLVLRGLFDPHGKSKLRSSAPTIRRGAGGAGLAVSASQRKPGSEGNQAVPALIAHVHDEEQLLKSRRAGRTQTTEIWPTSIVVPEGLPPALSVRGNDYEVDMHRTRRCCTRPIR